MARQRGRQVIAQRQPLLVIILKGKHALVRAVLIRQKLAQRIGVFDKGGFHRLETEALVDGADLAHHLFGCADIGRRTVGEATRQAGLQLLGLFLLVGHGGAGSSGSVGFAPPV